MADQLCFGNTSVAQAFENPENAVRGNHHMDRLPNIGPYLQQRLANRHVGTINAFLARIAQFHGATPCMRFCLELMRNARANQCAQHTQEKRYQVADANVCGYNTLIKLIQFAHQHRQDFAQWGFDQAYPCAFVQNLRLRTRGSNAGSRHCSCRNQHQCQHHPECRWNQGEQACVPRFGGDEGAGFRGLVMPNNHRRAQRKLGKRGRYFDRRYVEGWMMPGELPPRPRRGRRRRRPNPRYNSRDFVLEGGALQRAIRNWEQGHRNSELRRFHNFVELTKGFSHF